LTSNTLILYGISVRYNRNFLQNCAVNEHDSMCEVFAMPTVSSVPIFWNGINFGRWRGRTEYVGVSILEKRVVNRMYMLIETDWRWKMSRGKNVLRTLRNVKLYAYLYIVFILFFGDVIMTLSNISTRTRNLNLNVGYIICEQENKQYG